MLRENKDESTFGRRSGEGDSYCFSGERCNSGNILSTDSECVDSTTPCPSGCVDYQYRGTTISNTAQPAMSANPTMLTVVLQRKRVSQLPIAMAHPIMQFMTSYGTA